MLTVYFTITGLLLGFWLLMTVVGLCVGTSDGEDKDYFKTVAGVSFAGFVLCWLWPVIIVGVVPAWLAWGARNVLFAKSEIKRVNNG